MKCINFWNLWLAICIITGNLNHAHSQADLVANNDEQLIEFVTDRFTLPNLHVTPDKEHIIFDVLGDIYQVSIEGGTAEVLLQDKNWKRAGKLSPDGKTLTYISDEAGNFQVWTYNLQTKKKRKYPIIELGHYPLYPYWSTMGDLLIPSSEGLWSFNIKTGKGKIIRPAKEEERSIMHTVNQKMTIGKTGKKAFYQAKDTLWTFDLNQKIDSPIGKYTENRKPTFIRVDSNNSRALYLSKDKDDPMQLNLNSWDLENNKIRKIITLSEFEHNSTALDYSFDFIDDQTVILDKEGQIVCLDINTGEYHPIPIEVNIKKVIMKPLHRKPQYIKDSIITASVLRNPVTKSNLDTIYFGAFGKLRAYNKLTHTIKELYPHKDRFEVSSSLSPNGNYLAYTTWNDWNMGHLYVRELKTGKEFQITQQPGRYINPAWSPDGTKIVFIVDETEAKMGISRQTPGPNTSNYYLDVHQIRVFNNDWINKKVQTTKIKRIYPLSQLPRRFYPIPVYHPDGKSIYLSKRQNNKDLAVYAQIDLNSKEIIAEYPIPFHTEEILISPDGKHIAFIHDEQVWINDFPFKSKLEFSENSKFISQKFHYQGGYVMDILLPNAKSIYEIAPSYLYWQDKKTLMWGSAKEIYTYDLQTQRTNKIADIKVKKPRAVPKTQYALTNARIITINKDDDIVEQGTILIKDNRIVTVGPVKEVKIPNIYKTFDLRGKTVIPGLIDVHAHYHHGPYEFTNQQEYQYIGNLAFGVTTIYDPSVNVLDYREQAQMVETGILLGPRIFASGNIILGTSGPHEYAYKKINNLVDASRIIQSNKKLAVSGPIKEYSIKDKYKRQKLREAAKKEDTGITAHQSNYLLALSRIINGYTSIEHVIGNFSYHMDVTEFIGQSGIHYTPTYIVSPGIANIYADSTKSEKEKLLRFNSKNLYHNKYAYNFEYQNDRRQKTIDSWKTASVKLHKSTACTLKGIIKAEGIISVGGHGNPLPGIGTHWETWFMTKGMSNYQALQSITINGAKKLSLQKEIGSIEKGKLADLVVLEKNPLENIFNTINIQYVIQNGNIYQAETMRQIFPDNKKLKSWGYNSPIVLGHIDSIYKKK